MEQLSNVFVINLDKRPDRWQHIVNQFKKINFTNYTRVPAIDTQFGGLGCCLSHIAVLSQCTNGPIMIVEDDATFIVDRTTLDKYITEFLNDPADAMCLDFKVRKFCDYNKIFKRGLHTESTCCYIIKPSLKMPLLECFELAAKGLQTVKHNLDPNYAVYAIDQYWKHVQQKYIFLLPIVRCVQQYTNYSDISKKIENRK